MVLSVPSLALEDFTVDIPVINCVMLLLLAYYASWKLALVNCSVVLVSSASLAVG